MREQVLFADWFAERGAAIDFWELLRDTFALTPTTPVKYTGDLWPGVGFTTDTVEIDAYLYTGRKRVIFSINDKRDGSSVELTLRSITTTERTERIELRATYETAGIPVADRPQWPRLLSEQIAERLRRPMWLGFAWDPPRSSVGAPWWQPKSYTGTDCLGLARQ